MTMRSWVGRDFGVCVAVCVWVALAAPAAAAKTHPVAVPHPAAKAHSEGRLHPVAPAHAERASHAAASHVVVASHGAGRRRAAVQAEVEPKAGAKGRASKGKAGAKRQPETPARGTKPAAKATPKSKRGKHQQEEESENEPQTIYRADARRAKPEHERASRRDAVEAKPVMAAVTPREAPVREEAVTTSSDSDFVLKPTHDRRPWRVKAAEMGVAPASEPAHGAGTSGVTKPVASTETFESGESHPDDDVRVDMSVPASRVAAGRALPATAAVVTAGPGPVTPAGKATLPEKLHSMAVKAETALKVDAAAAKADVSRHSAAKTAFALPEDLAGKDAVIESAMTPQVLPNLYTAGGRLIVPPPMRGSRDILVHQNTMADKDGLDRIQDDSDLNRLRASHLLVAMQSSDALEVNSELPENRRYARPWTARFVNDTARAYYARFGTALRLNSAVRTVSYQLRLQRVNGNAAAVDGDGASPHLTGQAIDFGKRGMSVAEIAWMRAYLGPLMDAGKIDVEEEFQQACFHVSVYRSYVPLVKPKAKPALNVAQEREPQVHAAPIVRVAAKVDAPTDEVE